MEHDADRQGVKPWIVVVIAIATGGTSGTLPQLMTPSARVDAFTGTQAQEMERRLAKNHREALKEVKAQVLSEIRPLISGVHRHEVEAACWKVRIESLEEKNFDHIRSCRGLSDR